MLEKYVIIPQYTYTILHIYTDLYARIYVLYWWSYEWSSLNPLQSYYGFSSVQIGFWATDPLESKG